jgi:hypothetical protein
MNKKTHDRIEELAEDLQRRAIRREQEAKKAATEGNSYQEGYCLGKATAFELSARWLRELLQKEAA